jgi:hypothetical protein
MFKLIENPYLVVEVQHIVRRNWRERLLSRPWKPWIANKVEIEYVPWERVIVAGDCIIAHPEIIRGLRDELVRECMPWGMIN